MRHIPTRYWATVSKDLWGAFKARGPGIPEKGRVGPCPLLLVSALRRACARDTGGVLGGGLKGPSCNCGGVTQNTSPPPQILRRALNIESANALFVCRNAEYQEPNRLGRHSPGSMACHGYPKRERHVCVLQRRIPGAHPHPAPCPQVLWRIRKSGSDGEQHVRCSTNKKAVRYMACVCALHRTLF